MDKYAFPRTLFPSYEQLLHWSTLGSWDPFLQALRAQAALSRLIETSPDRELERFIHPLCRWDDGSPYALARTVSDTHVGEQHVLQDLGGGAWVADYEAMPFQPAELSFIGESLCTRPFSIAQCGLATFTRFRVLYVPPGARVQGRVTVSTDHVLLEYGAYVLCIIVGADAHIALDYTANVERGTATQVLLGWCGERSSVSIGAHSFYGSHAIGLNHELWQTAFGSSLESIGSVSGGVQVWSKKDYSVGEAASVSHVSLSALRGSEQEVLTTHQAHKGKESTSSVSVKAVLCDSSRSFYRGTIILEEAAQRAQAHQQQRALMVSTQARMCALPSLEVAAHTVRCSHGSAAGGLSDEQVRYLRAQGLSYKQAYDLLIEGFLQEGVGPRDTLKRVAHYLKGRCYTAFSQNPL